MLPLYDLHTYCTLTQRSPAASSTTHQQYHECVNVHQVTFRLHDAFVVLLS